MAEKKQGEVEQAPSPGRLQSLLNKVQAALDPYIGSFVDKGKDDVKAIRQYKGSTLWKSVFRHKLDDTPAIVPWPF